MILTNSHLLSDITDLYGLHQLINEPTRVTDTTSTLIDLIYTNYPDKVVCSGVCHVSISDHSLIFAYRKLSIGVASKRHNTIKYRSFKNFNRDYFRSDIASQNWDALDNFQDPNDMWREWKIKFLNVVDTHAPLRTKRVRLKRSPWITSELKKRMHERDIMKLKAIRSKNPQDWGEFKQFRNKVNSDIRILKESYYKQSFTENKNDSRRTWQTINELTSRKSNTPSIKELIINGVSVSKSTDLANAFNEHFSTVGPKLANQIPSAANGNIEVNESSSTGNSFFSFGGSLFYTTKKLMVPVIAPLCTKYKIPKRPYPSTPCFSFRGWFVFVNTVSKLQFPFRNVVLISASHVLQIFWSSFFSGFREAPICTSLYVVKGRGRMTLTGN